MMTEAETIKSAAIFELKHSIAMHTLILAGPTPELAVMLLKVIDFIEDEDFERREKEINHLAFIIVEALGVHTQKHIDQKQEDVIKKGLKFPQSVAKKNGDILVAIGKTRHIEDKIEAKNIVLVTIADALRELSGFTKSNYPIITNSHRKQL